MAEEHGFQASEGHRLCANNCGLFGSPTTNNFCSKCYRDIFGQQSNQNPVGSLFSPSKLSVVPSASSSAVESPEKSKPAVAAAAEMVAVTVATPNRCLVCRKKVGLTGFKCRCGTTFCGTHRYPELHGCTFDFKSMGREAIAKENPLIKAVKLEKI